MATKIIVCDDSTFAQKQLVKALPEDWSIDVTYAVNGEEALARLRENKGNILFLDLNMPVMDGYEVLTGIHRLDKQVRVVVVSGDIQPEAHARVMELGALAFIKKPVDREQVAAVLEQHGIFPESEESEEQQQVDDEFFDGYREITNIAVGQAADLLARVLKTFVVMPIPHVSMLEMSELEMAIDQVTQSDRVSAVCQGFIGGGIAGEAMLLFSDSNYSDIAEMINYEGNLDSEAEMELLMDLTNILIGACLKGIAEQFDINLSLGHPAVLGRHIVARELLNNEGNRWKRILAIDMAITVESKDIQANLLLLFTQESIPRINQLLSYAVA